MQYLCYTLRISNIKETIIRFLTLKFPEYMSRSISHFYSCSFGCRVNLNYVDFLPQFYEYKICLLKISYAS